MSFKFVIKVRESEPDVFFQPQHEIYPEPTALDSVRFEKITLPNGDEIVTKHSDVGVLLNEVRLSKDLHESQVKSMLDNLRESPKFDTSRYSDAQLHSLIISRSQQSFNDYQNISDELDERFSDLLKVQEKINKSSSKKSAKKDDDPETE